MNTVIGIIFLAAFAVIGTVQWLRALVEGVTAHDRKAILWPSVTGLFALFLGLTLAAAFPGLFDGLGAGPLTSPWFLTPVLFMLVLATIQLGYDIVVQTFLKLVKALGGLADTAVQAAEKKLGCPDAPERQ